MSESIENYLEAIFNLMREHKMARVKDIAERMHVSPPSVTGMLHTLSEQNLVNYEPYGNVTLTKKGEKLACDVAARHEALRTFLIDVLCIDKAEADAAACRMEHCISTGVMDRFVGFAEFMKSCPWSGVKWIEGQGYQSIPENHADEHTNNKSEDADA